MNKKLAQSKYLKQKTQNFIKQKTAPPPESNGQKRASILRKKIFNFDPKIMINSRSSIISAHSGISFRRKESEDSQNGYIDSPPIQRKKSSKNLLYMNSITLNSQNTLKPPPMTSVQCIPQISNNNLGSELISSPIRKSITQLQPIQEIPKLIKERSKSDNGEKEIVGNINPPLPTEREKAIPVKPKVIPSKNFIQQPTMKLLTDESSLDSTILDSSNLGLIKPKKVLGHYRADSLANPREHEFKNLRSLPLHRKSYPKVINLGGKFQRGQTEKDIKSHFNLKRYETFFDPIESIRNGIDGDQKKQQQIDKNLSKMKENDHRENESLNFIDKSRANFYLKKRDDVIFEKVENIAKSHIGKEALVFSSLQNLDEESRFNQAGEYFRSALEGRSLRYSFPSHTIKNIFLFQTNKYWRKLTYLLSWVYILLTFFEPANSHSLPFEAFSLNFTVNFCIEGVIILIFLADDMLEVIHRSGDSEKSKIVHFLKNYKFMGKILFDLSFLIDFILFSIYYYYGMAYFRFSRLFRPWKLTIHSKVIRREAYAILRTLPNIIDVVLLFLLATFIFSVLGYKLLSEDMTEDEESNIGMENNFGSIFSGIASLYSLISLSNYPDILHPYIDKSPYYIFFFLPFILMTIILFLPIPVAVIFQAYRFQRGRLYIKDRLKEKEIVYAVFLCIDIQNLPIPTISKKQWKRLMAATFYGKQDKDKVSQIFKIFDPEEKGYLDINTYFEACEMLLSLRNLKRPWGELNWWKNIKKWCNTKIHLKCIVTSAYFEFFIFMCVIMNLIILILYSTTDDEDKINTLDILDNVVVYIFLAECLLKIIALGINDYFNDNWNKLDFTLVIMSLIMNFAVQLMTVGRSAKTVSSAAKTTKSQRVIRILKGMRSFRTCKVLTASASSCLRIKSMLHKAFLILPNVQKLFALMSIIFYFYAIIGIEIYHPLSGQTNSDSKYKSSSYGNFENLENGLVALFQVLTQSGWHNLMFLYADSEDFNYLGTLTYFFSFHTIVVYIMISVVSGSIWEVFVYVDPDTGRMKEEEEDEEEDEKAVLDNSQIHDPNSNEDDDNSSSNCVIKSSIVLPSYSQFKLYDESPKRKQPPQESDRKIQYLGPFPPERFETWIQMDQDKSLTHEEQKESTQYKEVPYTTNSSTFETHHKSKNQDESPISDSAFVQDDPIKILSKNSEKVVSDLNVDSSNSPESKNTSKKFSISINFEEQRESNNKEHQGLSLEIQKSDNALDFHMNLNRNKTPSPEKRSSKVPSSFFSNTYSSKNMQRIPRKEFTATFPRLNCPKKSESMEEKLNDSSEILETNTSPRDPLPFPFIKSFRKEKRTIPSKFKEINNSMNQSSHRNSILQGDTPSSQPLSNYKTEYLQRQAFLKNENANIMKKAELDEMQKTFSSFKERCSKVMTITQEREVRAYKNNSDQTALIIQKTLQFVRRINSEIDFLVGMNNLFTEFEKICPPGTIMKMAFEIKISVKDKKDKFWAFFFHRKKRIHKVECKCYNKQIHCINKKRSVFLYEDYSYTGNMKINEDESTVINEKNIFDDLFNALTVLETEAEKTNSKLDDSKYTWDILVSSIKNKNSHSKTKLSKDSDSEHDVNNPVYTSSKESSSEEEDEKNSLSFLANNFLNSRVSEAYLVCSVPKPKQKYQNFLGPREKSYSPSSSFRSQFFMRKLSPEKRSKSKEFGKAADRTATNQNISRDDIKDFMRNMSDILDYNNKKIFSMAQNCIEKSVSLSANLGSPNHSNLASPL